MQESNVYPIRPLTPIPGWVYIIEWQIVDGMPFVKLGGTTRDPSIRLKELEYQLINQLDLFNTPQLYAAVHVDDVWQVENTAHKLLQPYATDRMEYYNQHPAFLMRALSRAVYMVGCLPKIKKSREQK